MSEKIIHRISTILDHYGLSKSAFDKRLELGNNYIGSMIRREGNVGADVIEKIVRGFPEISPGWLIAGEGEMFRGNDVVNISRELDAPEYEKDLFELTLLKYLEKPRVKDKILKLMNDGEEQKKVN